MLQTKTKIFPGLIQDSLSSKLTKKKICILTPDIHGPIRNGGVGTAYQCLSEALAKAGHEVTVLFTASRTENDANFDVWQKLYWSKGVRLISTPEPPMELAGNKHAQLSYAAYLYLKENQFDIVHAPEMNGLALYCLMAKKMGLGFANTLFCVTVHGPSEWHRKFNHQFDNHLDFLYFRYAERKVIELADVVTAPSQYILNWAIDDDFKLPIRTFVEQNLISVFDESLYSGSRNNFDEIVFFGRLETRKGIELFCNAVEELPKQILKRKKIVFLGNFGQVNNVDCEIWLKNRTKKWDFDFEIISSYNKTEALEYLTNRNALVVLASHAENLPYTGIECIHAKIPFIASAIPAFKELISKRNHKKVLFELSVEGLSHALKRVMAEGLPEVEFARSSKDSLRNWLKWHDSIQIERPSSFVLKKNPKVSVCIVHRNRSEFLKQCLEGFDRQTYKNFEVILVDNNSTKPLCRKFLEELKPTFQKRGWKILFEKENHGPGKARNIASKLATGEFLVFSDDDNVPKAKQLELFVNTISRTGVDIVTSPLDLFTSSRAPNDNQRPEFRWITLGDAVELGLFQNVYGDMTSCIRRQAFMEMGGLKEAKSPGFEDYEFFARAVLSGKKLLTLPEPVVWYRQHDNGLRRSSIYENVTMITDAYAATSGDRRFASILNYAAYWNHLEAVKAYHDNRKAAAAPLMNPQRTNFFIGRENFSKQIFAQKASELNKLKFDSSLKVQKTKLGPLIHDDKGGGVVKLPKLNLGNSKRVLVEIDLASYDHTFVLSHYQIKGLGRRTRTVSAYSSYRPGQKIVRLVLNARKFTGAIEISPLSGPGSCAIKRIVVLAE